MPAQTLVWEAALRQWADAELAAGRDGLHARATAVLERVLLDAALRASDGHRQQAAARLGLGRNTVTRKLASRRTSRP
jgi:two-component system nitrogen regulation response regulator GlnG